MPTPKDKAIAKRKTRTPAVRREPNPAREITLMIKSAIQQGLPAETMKQFVELHREMKADWAREQYFKSLATFQAKCPTVIKTRAVLNKNSTEVRYRYASLDQIIETVRPFLEKYGFSFTIQTDQTDKGFTSVAHVHHSAGHSEETKFTVPIDSDSYMNAPQRVASASTFSKRYALCNGLGILTGDEDLDGETPTEPERRGEPTSPEDAGKISNVFEDVCLLLEKNAFSDKNKKMWTDKAQRWFDEGSLTGLQSVHGAVTQQVARMRRAK